MKKPEIKKNITLKKYLIFKKKTPAWATYIFVHELSEIIEVTKIYKEKTNILHTIFFRRCHFNFSMIFYDFFKSNFSYVFHLIFFILFLHIRKKTNQMYFALACPTKKKFTNFLHIFWHQLFASRILFWKKHFVYTFYFIWFVKYQKKINNHNKHIWLFCTPNFLQLKTIQRTKQLDFCNLSKRKVFANFTIVRVTRLDFDEALQHCRFLGRYYKFLFLLISMNRYIQRCVTSCQIAQFFALYNRFFYGFVLLLWLI